MITQTISEKQISRAQRAADQRRNYSCRSAVLWGRQVVYVTKLKAGQPVCCYTVTFRTAGVPVCNCKDGQRHRGTALLCKHAVLAVVHRRDEEQAAAEAEPVTISDEEWDAFQKAWELEEARLAWERQACPFCDSLRCVCPTGESEPDPNEITFRLVGGEWIAA